MFAEENRNLGHWMSLSCSSSDACERKSRSFRSQKLLTLSGFVGMVERFSQQLLAGVSRSHQIKAHRRQFTQTSRHCRLCFSLSFAYDSLVRLVRSILCKNAKP